MERKKRYRLMLEFKALDDVEARLVARDLFLRLGYEQGSLTQVDRVDVCAGKLQALRSGKEPRGIPYDV